MARQPVQLPSRGGANAAGVGSRAQYLRPAKDTQNSRALASAFSQMNRAFGRIAANEQRLANARLQDEFEAAEEQQDLLEQRAKYAGLMDAGLGTTEQAALYEANPAAQRSYQEGRVAGMVSQYLLEVQEDFKRQDFFGKPESSDVARAWFQDSVATAFEGVDSAMLAENLQSIMSVQSSLLTAHANKAFETAKSTTTRDLSFVYEAALLSGNLPGLQAAEFEGRNNAFNNFGSQGNKISADALVRALNNAAARDPAEFAVARENYRQLVYDREYAKLFRPEVYDTLTAGLQNATNLHNTLASNAQASRERVQEEKKDAIRDGIVSRWEMGDSNFSAETQALIDIGMTPEDAVKEVNGLVTALSSINSVSMERQDAQSVAVSSELANQLKHQINVEGLTGAQKLALVEANADRLTKADQQSVISFQPDGQSPIMTSDLTRFAKSSISGLADNINLTQLENFAFLNAISMGPTDGSLLDAKKSGLKTYIIAQLEEELRVVAASWPQDGNRNEQQEIIDQAMFRVLDHLDRRAEGGLMEMFYAEGQSGIIDSRYVNDPSFKRWFERTGYLETHQKLKAAERAANAAYSQDAARRASSSSPMPRTFYDNPEVSPIEDEESSGGGGGF